MRIVITGAAGRIGREVAAELSPQHELVLIDRRLWAPHVVRATDLGWPGEWMRLMQGADCVIHLAANSGPNGRAHRLIKSNVLAPFWVVVAAFRYRVPRVVFASSGWVVRAVEESTAPQCYSPNGPKIDASAFGPRTLYGWSKAWGEFLGRLFVRARNGASFMAVRIGWFGAGADQDPRGRRVWLGAKDLRAFFRRTVEANYSGYIVTYAASAQDSVPYDLSGSNTVLGWRPTELPPPMVSA
jgi:uronate dehydrogenase